MGLFDHLFKAKSPTGEEKVGEPAIEGSPAAKPAEGPPRSHPPQRADPSAFLHPKSFVPRGAPGLTPAPRPSSAISAKAAERRTAAGPPPAADEIVLTLGDVLSRIPTHYLKSGAHDSKRELRFKINDLSSDIARGRAAVPLSRIAQLAPEIFVKEISRDEDTEVRLPLQKLVEQIGLLRSQPKISVVEKLARPVTGGEVPPVARSGAPLETRQSEPIVVQSVVEPIPSTAGQSPASPFILAEPASPQRTFELKPMAEQAAPPVILGPPPVIETPAATVTPLAPVLPEPEAPLATPEPPPAILEPAPPVSAFVPPIPEATPPVEPATLAAPAPEPAPVVPSSSLATPPPIPDAQNVVIDEGGDMETKTAGESAPQVEPAAEGTKLAPLESPQLDTGEECIQLSLAAILRNCPPEILVGPQPHVDDSVRITLPFAPIDRQLVKGQVEVSALRFIAALPEVYQKYFVAKVGVKVPIPLEEVFQNLPTPSQQITPTPPLPATVFLAPALSTTALAAAAARAAEKEEEPPVPPVPITPPAAAEPPPIPSMAVSPAPEIMAASSAPEIPEIAPPEMIAPLSALVPEPEPVVESALPLESVHDVAPAAEQVVPPVDLAAAAEAPPAAEPATDLTPPPLPTSPAIESASMASSEPPKIAFQPPVFRPHFLPPPPIFRSAPSPTAPEAESAAKPEPSSVLAGPTELVAASPSASIPEIPESAPLEANAAVAPAPEALAAEAPFVAPPVEMPVPASQPSEAEALPEAGSEGEQSADLMAFAGEHSAPDLVQFSSEPVPHADLTETLAHETTYAPDLAEVVHMPEDESSQPKAPVAAEEPAVPVALEPPLAPVHEHHAVPILEGLAAAAVAETIAEHAPLHFHDVAPVVEPPKAPDEVVTSGEMLAAEKSTVEEPVAAEEPVIAQEAAVAAEPIVAEEPAPLVPVAEQLAEAPVAPAESIPGPESQAPAPETPEPPVSETPTDAVPPAAPPPPPLPFFPPPKLRPEPVHAELTHVEVLPPALPLRRFDQDAVQQLFMTEETLDLPKISRLAATLPGVYACVIATRDQACTGGTLPDGFDLAALLGLAPRVGEAAGRMPIGQLKHFTLYGDAYSVSFFERNGLSLCAVHRPRSFVPGVREKLVALADELSR